MSGGKGKKVIVGYKYYLGVQLAVCHGPVDNVSEIIVGERQAWTGSVTSSSTISINQPNLFGGDSREGGVVGAVDIMMGEPGQGRNAYLQAYQGATTPAYRGLLSVVFKSFLWASGNPYFKAPWVRVTRRLQGWARGSAWNPGTASIGTYDMNPAHIIYECLTDFNWGMGYNPTDIDDTSFMACASKLSSEAFGLSIAWTSQATINDFIKVILDHINGTLRMDLKTGKFTLKLIRDDYTIGSLTNLNPSNIIELRSFQRAAYGDAANEVVVSYFDRDENERTLAVQDLASIQAQGAVVSTTRSYPGIRDDSLAARVAVRDLNTSSSQLAKAIVVANRVLWDKEIGDAVSLTWPDLGITLAAFRIVSINKGNLLDGKIEAELVEDVFGLSSNAYTSGGGTNWVDPLSPPVAVQAAKAYEAPYWEIVTTVSRADQAELEPLYGFGIVAATRGATAFPLNFTLSASPDNASWEDVATGAFSPTGTLAADISRTQTSFSLSGFYDLEQVVLDADNGYAWIDNEAVAVVSVDIVTGAVVVRRGVLDTVPALHSVGARVFFVTELEASDPTERTSGETVYYRPRPKTGLGILPIGSAVTVSLTMQNRASRPYPPGMFRVNSAYWPTNVSGSISASWTHRDRTQQTVSLIDYLSGNIGPEAGATYTVRLYKNGTTLVRTYSGLTGTTWAYLAADELTDLLVQTLRITLVTAVAGVESLYPQDATVERYGLGFHLGDSLGGSAPP